MDKPALINKIKSLDGLSQDEKAALIDLLNQTKKYGLVWEDKPEAVEEQLRTQLPVLIEVPERRILAEQLTMQTPAAPPDKAAPTPDLFSTTETSQVPTANSQQPIALALSEAEGNSQQPKANSQKPTASPPNHILIEGDNLHALTALTFTHEGRIDVIYIDPPYNTGSKDDFIFNDHYVDKEDAFRHSKWLSFMEKRLKLSKRLLADDGVIFCSIGDDENAQLTMLFNEVFRDDNKLGAISRVAKTAGDMGNYFAPSKDYILVYSKNQKTVKNFKDGVDERLFKKIEKEGLKKGERYRDDVAFYQASQKDLRPNQKYFVDCPDGSKVIPPCSIQDEIMRDGDGRWRWSKDTYFKFKHLLVFKATKQSPLLDENGHKAKWNVYTKSYLNDRSEKGASPRDYLDNFINRKGADLIKQYDIEFNFSKPFELIQHLIKITNKPNDIKVLDFFAGSGTTLHSVLSLNAIDKGQRTCILVTNNENKICDNVTYPRCQRIIYKYVNYKGKEMPYFPENNLRYFKTAFVNREKTTKNKKQLTLLATELLCIKEDIYTELFSIKDFKFEQKTVRCFSDKGKYLMVIYDEEIIEQLVPVIAEINSKTKIKIYVFAPGQYPFTEEFEDVLHKIELGALPDAIYKAYMSILPKKSDRSFSEQPTPETDITETSEDAESDLFTENIMEP